MLERYALPGQLVVGSDSHTTHAGAVGALAFGIGTSEVACAWLSRDVRVEGSRDDPRRADGRAARRRRREGRHARPPRAPVREGRRRARPGPRVRGGGRRRDVRGRARDPHEHGGRGGRVRGDRRARRYDGAVPRRAARPATGRGAAAQRGSRAGSRRGLRLGPHARRLRARAARRPPGRPRQRRPHRGPRGAGARSTSRTAGRARRASARTWRCSRRSSPRASRAGRRVAPGVRFYVQFGSRDVREWCRGAGATSTSSRAPAPIAIEPGCGACIAAGPGVSTRPGEVTVSAINRNFPGRSGPGSVYLASPYVVAASALAGRITAWTPGA